MHRALLLLVLGLAAACHGAPPPAHPAPSRARVVSKKACKCEIDRVLDAFHAAAARADEPAYFALFAPTGVFLGTDASERWGVAAFREFAHPHFASGKGWTYLPRGRQISFSADAQVAWFDELLDHEKYGELRGSGVLIKLDGAWKIAQYNLTFTVPNAVAPEVVALRKGAPQAAQ
jgi:hypothetical protein